MTEGPIRASDVEKTQGKPDPDILRDRAKSAVHRRAARREAMDRLGLTGQGTPGHVEKIEARSEKAALERMAAFRASRGSGTKSAGAVKEASTAARAAVATRLKGNSASAIPRESQ